MVKTSYKMALVFIVAVAMLLACASLVYADTWADVDESLVGSYGVTMEQLGEVSSGYPDGDWRPWMNITRGQFAKMAVTGFGVELVYPETATFTDVPDTHQFFVYVESANVAGLMQGVGERLFGVESPVTREQAIAVVARKVAADHAYDLEAMTDEEIGAILAAFSDGALVSPSLRAEVAFAVKQGLVKGNASGVLQPQASMSRIAAATVLIRAKTPRPLVLDMNDDSRIIKIAVNETMEVALNGNPTTGYAWTVVLPPDSATILEQVGEPEYVADSDALGAGGTYTFTFLGLAAGEVELKLEYARPFETEPPLETFSVTVKVETEPADAPTFTLVEEDDGTTVAVKPGETIDVVLEGNPTTGYGWTVDLSAEDAAILEQVGEPTYVPDSELIGAGGTYTFRFRALAVGEVTLVLNYARPWESVPPLKTFSVTVQVGGEPALVLDEEDDGTTVAVKPGDTIDVVLEGNPTTGYGWTVDLSAEDAAILEQVGEPTYVPDSGLIGAGGTYTFRFKALVVGEATLVLNYARSWESVPPLKTFSVTVVVAPTPSGGDVTPLEGTSWKLEGWSVSMLDPRDFEITATFEEGRMSGKAAVNLYGADCTAGAEGSFSLGPIVQTLMAGPAPAMQAETTYFGLLQEVRSYVLDGDELTLLDEGANELLIFTAVVES